MKKFWVLLMLVTSVTAHAQKAYKPVIIKVVTTQQKTVTGILYSISDSTISLCTDSKIKWEELQSLEINNRSLCSDSAESCSASISHILITTFSFREIEKVKTPIRNAVLLGIITGAVIGVQAGMLVGPALDANHPESQNSSAGLAVDFLALNGAIIGGMIIPHYKTYAIHADERNFKKDDRQVQIKILPLLIFKTR